MDELAGATVIEALGPHMAAFLPEEGGPARLLSVRRAPPAARAALAGMTFHRAREVLGDEAFGADGIAADAAPLLAEIAAPLRAARRVEDGRIVLLAWGRAACGTPLARAFDALRPPSALPFEDVFENAAHAMAVVGSDRRLYAANRAGRRILAGPGALGEEAGRLRTGDAEDDRRLDAALAGASDRARPVTLTLDPRGGGPGLRCELGRIDRPMAAHGGSARFLLTATPMGGEPPVEALLAERFGLTGAEARLAAHLAEGRDLRAAGEAMGVSRHTARKYLQIAFSKMGVRRQADLVRHALRLVHAAAE